MNIETIRAFLEVAATGSFQQAAENLYITQSAMSARIKTLEELLNRQLFNRKRNGATLTSGGQAFYQYALSIVRTWEMARQEIALNEKFSTVVGIGVQLNHWKSTAAPWQQWMKENAEDIATQVHSDYSDRLMSMLRGGLLDVAVLYEPQQNPELLIEKYVEERLILVCSEPRAVQRLSVDGYVFVDWGKTFRTEHAHEFPDAITNQMTVGMAAVALNHILEQGGSGYFLERELTDLLESEALFLVEGAPQISLPTYLAYYSGERLTPEVLKALEGLRYIRSL
ncbi:MAG: LysR family transcriptional regulator [Pseudomonadales bacterium]